MQRAVGGAAYHVGEGATAIDPKLPAIFVHSLLMTLVRRSVRHKAVSAGGKPSPRLSKSGFAMDEIQNARSAVSLVRASVF